MHKRSILCLAVFFSAVFSVTLSCKKDRVPQDDYQDMDSFYNDNQEEEQELQVDSGSGSCFVTAKKGTRICVTRDMLRDAGGNDIPSYPFQLKVIELYSIKDMILRRQPSTSGGSILEISAEIKVRPFKDGNEAFLKQGKRYGMETANITPTDSSMISYYGFDNGGIGDWTSSLSTIIPGFVDSLSTVVATPSYYILTPANTGYVSAAKQHSSTAQYTPVTVTVAGTNTQNIQIYIVFNNYKSVMKVTNLLSSPVPVGESVTLVAFAKKQTNEFVLDQQTFTVVPGQQIALNWTVVSETNLIAALAGL
jgi:hypothetical protein